MIKKIALSLLLMVSVSYTFAQVKFETGALSEVTAKVKGTDKLIFIDLYASWCPPCKMMERDVFSREDVGNYMNTHFANAKYNVDEKLGGEMSRKYGVSSIPTYIILKQDGTIVGRMTGAMKADEFISSMKEIVKKGTAK